MAQLKSERVLLGPRGGPGFIISAQQFECLDMLHNGLSIKMLVHHYFKNGWAIAFNPLRDMIEYMVEEGLILNTSFKKYFHSQVEERLTKKPGFMHWIGKAFQSEIKIDVEKEIDAFAFFRSLDDQTRRTFMKHAKVITIPANTRLCQQGKTQSSLFALVSGEASVFKQNPSGRATKLTTLERGSVFGEVGFFLNQPRTADVITDSECVILHFTSNEPELQRLIDEENVNVLRERFWLIRALTKSKMLADIPPDCFDAMIMAGEIVKFPAQRWLCREGDMGNTCYILIKGHVEVTRENKPVRALGEGELWGELALMATGGIRTASIYSSTEILAFEIHDHSFYELLAENLYLACQFESMALKRLASQRDSA